MLSYIKHNPMFKSQDKTIWLYYLSKFFVGLRFYIPVWLIFGKLFLDLSGLGILEAITYLITIFVDIPSGALADQIGRKKVIIIGLILLGGGHVLLGFSGDLWQYALFGIISNIGASFIAGSDSALIYDHLLEKKQQDTFVKVQSYGTFAFRIGIIIATFMGGFLYGKANYLPFLLMGIFELLSIVFWVFIKEPNLDSEKFSLQKYFQQMRTGVSEVIKSKYLRPLTAYYVLIGGITYSCFFFLNYAYAAELGFGANEQSVLFGVVGIVKAFAVLMIGIMYKYFNRKRVFLGFALIMVIFFLPAAFAGVALAVVIITVIDMLGAVRIALLDKFINDEISSQNRATTLSFVNMLINAFYLLIVWLGTAFAEKAGTNVLYTVFGFISLLIILPLAFWLLKRRPEPQV